MIERQQINVRLEKDLAERMDEKRIDLRKSLGYIPTRSDVLRMALEQYLGVTGIEKPGYKTQVKHRKKSG